MFKKNPNRPPITISLRKVNTGYKVLSNESFNPFSFKRITRAIFKNQLQNAKGSDALISGMVPNSTIIQPPSHITIPVSAKWFDYDQIHQIEREAFGEFFIEDDLEGKLFRKSPKLYKYYRNFIITLWRENSKKYLSPAVCRKNLPGDVSAIIRIHAFLEHWGLINFPSKQHTKGYVQAKSEEYCCHVCQQLNASQYYVCRVDEQTIFQVCDCCYLAEIYPKVLKQLPFRKIIPEVHRQLRKKKMTAQQTSKMLQIINSQSNRQKQLWNILSQTFPNYTKQQLVQNFLQIPVNNPMNSSIFSNSEDTLPDPQPPVCEPPTIFQDYQNQQQLSIAMCYYLYRTQGEKYPQLAKLFQAAMEHARYLAEDQNRKCTYMIRMLIDVMMSKLELKAMFIQELEKLVQGEAQGLRTVAANLMAEEIKNVDYEEMSDN